jgi:hypothetical protein
MELSCIRVWHACTTAPRLERVLLGAVYGFVDVRVKEPVVSGYGMKQMYVRDPDGYALCFQWAAERRGP